MRAVGGAFAVVTQKIFAGSFQAAEGGLQFRAVFQVIPSHLALREERALQRAVLDEHNRHGGMRGASFFTSGSTCALISSATMFGRQSTTQTDGSSSASKSAISGSILPLPEKPRLMTGQLNLRWSIAL